ncbi:MAG: hypothetical protein H0X29_02335 [Parachlamydiaceae bacterium]|nr:hypothetical protein [Parachlamydiaceae bacterium]
MDAYTMALFGEAEKGDYRTAYFCHSLDQLLDALGNPPPQSRGLHYAVQALLYHRELIFFRVREEGFSYQDYLLGLNNLKNAALTRISAICLPGVGDSEIIDAISPICAIHHSILITNEADFYDYLTELSA